ncbi:hypothetical protein HMI56_003710 [Coelomomyces lativittatus]|nr:hypothetical protein HMI56_003710 [Coelomomyces lativittatus]
MTDSNQIIMVNAQTNSSWTTHDLLLPPLPNRPRQCHFFLKKKKRYCTMTTKVHSKYCGEHRVMDSTYKNTDEERTPCPLDPRHTVQRSKLNQHLLKCNANVPSSPCFQRNVNVPMHSSPFVDVDLTLDAFLLYCDDLYQRFLIEEGPIPMETLHSKDHVAQTKHGLKHTLQHAALFHLLNKYAQLESLPLCVEFGAGKGEFSHYIQQQTTHLELKYLLIDRQNFKLKHDRYFPSTHCQRLCMDIKDLALVPTYSSPLIGYSKHLCGAATDLTLRCLTHSTTQALVLALCCHQLCTLVSYVGHQDGLPFSLLTKLSSWAVSHPDPIHRSRGYQCKRILDWGRVRWLRDHGFQAKLVQYVDHSTSPENCALVAWK